MLSVSSVGLTGLSLNALLSIPLILVNDLGSSTDDKSCPLNAFDPTVPLKPSLSLSDFSEAGIASAVFSNADLPMLVTLPGIVTSANWLFINALSPIFFRLSGRLTVVALQPTNALLPISVTPSGITISVTAALSASPTVSLVLPNATSGISFSDFEITIFSARSVPLNAPVPSFVTEFGSTIDVSLALRNAELPIDSSPSGKLTIDIP